MTSRTEYNTQTSNKPSLFDVQYLRNHRTLDIGVLGYIGIVWPKEHSPEVRSFPPGTPCILCYIMLCYITLCYVMLCCVMLYYIMLYYDIIAWWSDPPLSALAPVNNHKMNKASWSFDIRFRVTMGRFVTNKIWIVATVHHLILQPPNLPMTPTELSLKIFSISWRQCLLQMC